MLIETKNRIFRFNEDRSDFLRAFYAAISEHDVKKGLAFYMSKDTKSELLRYKDDHGRYFCTLDESNPKGHIAFTVLGMPIVIDNDIGRVIRLKMMGGLTAC